jgi:hypothetical protein
MIGVGGPEIFTPKARGYVYTAQETAQMMRLNAPQSLAMPSVVVQGNDNAEVVRELRRLQAIIASQPAPRSDTNHFVLGDNGSNVFGMVTEALSALHNKRR